MSEPAREGDLYILVADKNEERLGQVGWQGRSAAIVIDPELEAWVWSDSPHVESALGWGGRRPDLKTWLREEGHLLEGESKPGRPKEVVEKALWTARKPRSSSIYQRLAERVSFQRCEDAAFRKLLRLLREWFPADPGA